MRGHWLTHRIYSTKCEASVTKELPGMFGNRNAMRNCSALLPGPIMIRSTMIHNIRSSRSHLSRPNPLYLAYLIQHVN